MLRTGLLHDAKKKIAFPRRLTGFLVQICFLNFNCQSDNFWKLFEMKLATCATLMGVLPESTDSLKTSYLSRENTYRLVIVDFEAEEVRYALCIKVTTDLK